MHPPSPSGEGGGERACEGRVVTSADRAGFVRTPPHPRRSRDLSQGRGNARHPDHRFLLTPPRGAGYARRLTPFSLNGWGTTGHPRMAFDFLNLRPLNVLVDRSRDHTAGFALVRLAPP